MKNSLLIAGALAASLALPAFAAAPSNPSEFRGYRACLDSVSNQFESLNPARNYYLSRNGDSRTYYINTKTWENGEWVNVGLRCDTSANGRDVLSSTVTSDRFALTDRRSVQIASQ